MTRVREWYEDHENIHSLLRFLDERCELADVDAAIRVVEKPWHWTPEYNEMLAAERTAAIEGQPA